MIKARKFGQETDALRKTLSHEEAEKKILALRNKEVERLLFKPFIDKLTVQQAGQGTLFAYM